MEDVEVLVVGAGPAGSTAAFELARRGHDVVVLEEHGAVGYPVQCAGLVSQRVLDLAGSTNFVRRAVHGAVVYAPSLRSIRFHAAEPRAFVIDRAGLDIALADRAARAGARFRTATKFDRLHPPENGRAVADLVAGDGTTSTVRARLIIGADGVSSAVARAFRLRRPVEILPAFEAEFPSGPGDADEVEVYLGNDIAPGLFGWSIPDGFGGSRVGVAARAGPTTAREYYNHLVRAVERQHRTTLRNPTNYLVSGIPVGELPRTSGDGVLLIGDAAAQVKPLSGGGIFLGMRCAQIAAEVADRALRADDVSSTRLREYDLAWRAELGDELAKALYLRRLFVRLSDADLESVIHALSSAGMTESIVAFGDIDFPTHVARRLLRQSPSLVRLFPKALGAFWSSGETRAPDVEPGPRRTAT